jgi:hypothetical protein
MKMTAFWDLFIVVWFTADWSCRWDETMSLNRGHQRAYCSSPRWYMSIEKHGEMMMPAGNNSCFVHQSPLAILSAESSGSKYEKWTEEVRVLPCKHFVHTCKWFLPAVKS